MHRAEVTAKVGSGEGTEVTVTEQTQYPFGEQVALKIAAADGRGFPAVSPRARLVRSPRRSRSTASPCEIKRRPEAATWSSSARGTTATKSC